MRKKAMVLVCAVAISFSALCAGFGNNFTKTQVELMNKISNREIWVVNATAPGRIQGETHSLPLDLAFTKEEFETISKISELEMAVPYFEFVSSQYVDGQTEDETREITVNYPSGKQKKVLFGSEQRIYNFSIVPYLPDQLMDLKSETLDETVENGIYLSAPLAEVLGVESPQGVSLTADALVPAKLKEVELSFEEEKETVQGDLDVCALDVIGGKVRGVLESQVKNNYTQNSEYIIYVPYDQMKTILESAQPEELKEGESKWMPSACIVTASSYHAVTSAKEKLSRMGESFLVYNRFQDFESMNASIHTVRDMTFLVSIVILAIIFLLMAVIYMNYVEGRKFEYSILKANGITRRELRKLVYLESLLQAAKTMVISLLCAVILGLVTNFLVFQDEMISFDWKLLVTVLGISLLSIVIPTIITLTFINRYDPDQVMRR